MLADFDAMCFEKVKLVMDKSFFSIGNINGLFKERLKFLVSAGILLKFIRNELDKAYDYLQSFEYYSKDHQLYLMMVPYEWDYTWVRLNKGYVLEEKRQIYVHLYYNLGRALEDQKHFDLKFMMWRSFLWIGCERCYYLSFVTSWYPGFPEHITSIVRNARNHAGSWRFRAQEEFLCVDICYAQPQSSVCGWQIRMYYET